MCQRGPLTRCHDDSRLKLDNNASERELRRVAVGRKAWMFVGSDDHVQAAGNLNDLDLLGSPSPPGSRGLSSRHPRPAALGPLATGSSPALASILSSSSASWVRSPVPPSSSEQPAAR
ncbi:MAG: transposase [Myxococcota bacterium]|nr:transposase [Myxococcota bacterium]